MKSEKINLSKDELEYLWGFLMAMVLANVQKGVKDKRLMGILTKIKRQKSYLLSMGELMK